MEGSLDCHLDLSKKRTHDDNEENDSADDSSPNSETSSSSSGSWSIDDSIEFMQTSHKPMFDELPTFSIKSASPLVNGSFISSEPISLFNLSISPISSIEDISCFSDDFKANDEICQIADAMTNDDEDDDERISIEEITAQINTPPSTVSRSSNKRLNLETIFEDVFLETPKKRRFNGFRKFNCWRIEQRINSFVVEQQKNHNEQDGRQDTTNALCNVFDDKININTNS